MSLGEGRGSVTEQERGNTSRRSPSMGCVVYMSLRQSVCETVSACGGTHEVTNNFNKVKFYGRPHIKIPHFFAFSFRA